jgi:hypothetical protein
VKSLFKRLRGRCFAQEDVCGIFGYDGGAAVPGKGDTRLTAHFLARKKARIYQQPRGKCREVARSCETHSENISIVVDVYSWLGRCIDIIMERMS